MEVKSYKPLARRYRPQNLQSLVGQEVLVNSLTQAFKVNRVPSAILLHGIRGIGKTTTARIIAKCLNCFGADGNLSNPTYNPCDICVSCHGIILDKHLDVVEIDAASRTGVDDIREIIDSIPYKAVQGRFKVFIIDEVHMLSKSAFNALLKTLEEPPTHVKFIFATTEIRKIPATVLSRCMVFDLRRLSVLEIAQHLGKIAHKEGVEFEEEAVLQIARAADGSMRDGLSLLDQAIIASRSLVNELSNSDTDHKITLKIIEQMLGCADRTVIFSLVYNLFLGDGERILEQSKLILEQSLDPLLIMTDILDVLYWVICAKNHPKILDDPTFPEADRQFVRENLQSLGVASLMQMWQVLLKGYDEVQKSPMPNQTLQMLLLRVIYIKSLPPLADFLSDKASFNDLVNNENKIEFSNGNLEGANNHLDDLHKGNDLSLNLSNVEKKTEIQDFFQLIEILQKNKEMILVNNIKNFVRPINCGNGILHIGLEEGCPENFLDILCRSLKKHTGIDWKITLSKQFDAKTVKQQIIENNQKMYDLSVQHPFVQKIQNIFPDGEISVTIN